MFIKNLLVAGDYVIPVPVGLPVTLQYDQRGVLQKVFNSFENKNDVSKALLKPIVDNNTVPARVSLQGGTTWVKGVLWTVNHIEGTGSVPECICDSMISDYVANPTNYRFLAGNVSSMATVFKGAVPVRTWLSAANFDTLPGFLVPAVVTKSNICSMVKTIFKYNYPLVSHYIVYHSGEVKIESTQLQRFVVSKVQKYTQGDGRIRAKVYKAGTEGSHIDVSYLDIVKHNVLHKSLVTLDNEGNIIHSYRRNIKQEEMRSPVITCEFCGSLINVTSPDVMCTDPSCTSKLYNKLTHFLNTLNLPSFTYPQVLDMIKAKEIFNVVDILDTKQFAETKLSITLSAVLASLISVIDIANRDIFTKFANACTNNVKTFSYYVDNPDRIVTQLNLSGIWATKLVNWLSDSSNAMMVHQLLENENVTIVKTNKKFDGPLMFRNKTICITGLFRHGNFDDVTGILASYGAEVVYDYTDAVDCVIVGDMNENVSGIIINQAKNSNKKIFKESDFFAEYDIDSDLQANLV